MVIRSLHLDDIFEILTLQTVFVSPHAVDGKNNVLGSEWRAVVETDAFAKMKYPVLPLKFARLGQYPHVAHRPVGNMDSWLIHVLPHSINQAAAMIVWIEGIGDARAKDRYALFGSGPCRCAEASRRYDS